MTTGTYTPHAWVEYAGTGSDKAGWLNHLETQYDESEYYWLNTTHDARYYTQAENIAKYFNTANDGAGSGLVAATIDGVSGDSLINSGASTGIVAIWHGAVTDVPAGWHICDGRDAATPDLRDRIPVACGTNIVSTYVLGQTGGYNSSTFSGTVTPAEHVITLSEMASHTHTYTDTQNTEAGGALLNVGASTYWGGDVNNSLYTEYTGGGLGHNHTPASLQGATFVQIPSAKAYYYIIKE